MMMEKGTVNSSGEGESCTQKFLLCGLGVSAFPLEQELAAPVAFPLSSAEGSGGRLKEAVLCFSNSSLSPSQQYSSVLAADATAKLLCTWGL